MLILGMYHGEWMRQRLDYVAGGLHAKELWTQQLITSTNASAMDYCRVQQAGYPPNPPCPPPLENFFFEVGVHVFRTLVPKTLLKHCVLFLSIVAIEHTCLSTGCVVLRGSRGMDLRETPHSRRLKALTAGSTQCSIPENSGC